MRPYNIPPLLRRLTTAVCLAACLLVTAAAVTACGARQVDVPAAPDGDVVLTEGREIYIRNCASCHGASGGGGRGPRLNEGRVLAEYPAIEDQISVVRDGQNNMPAFGGKFSEEQLEAVVRFTREVLAAE